MKRASIHHAAVLTAAVAWALPGPAGCLHGTDDDAEDPPFLGAGELTLDSFPGLTEQGIDPPDSASDGPHDDYPFSGYDCDNADRDDDPCEYLVCHYRDGWDSVAGACEEGFIDAEECATLLSCLRSLVECIEDRCHPQLGIDYDNRMDCNDDYLVCVGYW